MKQHLRNFGRSCAVFILCIAIFTGAMAAAFAIPNSAIESNQRQAVAVIESEGQYPRYFFDTPACQLDNFTDGLMLDRAINPDESRGPLVSAMDIEGYSRYWHGYQVFLRPALTLLNYKQIRYLNMMVFFILLAGAFALMQRKMGTRPAVGFLVSVAACYAIIIPLSMQFMSVFVLMLLGCIWVLWRHGKTTPSEAVLFFMVLGMTTNFLDLLTAPLLTLGMPLAVYLYLEIASHPENGWFTGFKRLFFPSLAWGLGYGGCWVCKWAVGSLVLRRNVFAEAISQIFFRVSGSEDYPLDRMEALSKNFDRMFVDPGKRLLLLLGIILGLWLLLALLFRKSWKQLLNGTVLLLVALYPYAWILVMANHCQIHYWFTYRIQAVALFAIVCWLDLSVDAGKIRGLFQKKN